MTSTDAESSRTPGQNPPSRHELPPNERRVVTSSRADDEEVEALAGPRPTKQRLAVARVLANFDDFRTAQEIHALLAEEGEAVGLATVYRNLQRLAEGGEVDVLRTEEGESAYRWCSDTHHHHLVCRNCGATVEVEGPTVERWTSGIAGRHGYTDVSHTLEIFGTCPQCRGA